MTLARLNIGYMKIGRSMQLTSRGWNVVGGDQESIIILRKLAEKYPQYEFYILGKNSGESPAELKISRHNNVTNPWLHLKSQGTLPFSDGVTDARSARDYTERLYSHVTEYFRHMDGLIIWLGQHGTSNNPIPKVGNSWDDSMEYFTKPQHSFLNYASFIIRGVNEWRDIRNGKGEEIWLCTDCRNYIKGRDLKWPVTNPVLALYDQQVLTKHDRWADVRSPEELKFPNARWVGPDDPGVWYHPTNYTYSGVEIATILPNVTPNFTWEGRKHLGLIINEARSYVEPNRLDIMSRWVMPLNPYFIHGKWSDEAMKALGTYIEPVTHRQAFAKLQQVRSTFATPSSGSGWATRKAWEAFAAGTVCFFHPMYDTQGHVLPTLDMLQRFNYAPEVVSLVKWLRADSPLNFWKRVKLVHESKDLWNELVTLQYKLFQLAMKADIFMKSLDTKFTEWEVMKYGSASQFSIA